MPRLAAFAVDVGLAGHQLGASRPVAAGLVARLRRLARARCGGGPEEEEHGREETLTLTLTLTRTQNLTP